MKCPVCHTKTNQAICPNCGFTLKKEEQTIVKETVSQQSIPQEDDFTIIKRNTNNYY